MPVGCACPALIDLSNTRARAQVVWMAGLPNHWPAYAPTPDLIDLSHTYLDELANITGLQVRCESHNL